MSECCKYEGINSRCLYNCLFCFFSGRGARLSVYFKETQFTAIKRTVMYGITTLIANCGGIFGLFMGISSLSLIEFIYFFSVRLCSNLRKRSLIKKKILQQEVDIGDE